MGIFFFRLSVSIVFGVAISRLDAEFAPLFFWRESGQVWKSYFTCFPFGPWSADTKATLPAEADDR
jgi:hypothetical protein